MWPFKSKKKIELTEKSVAKNPTVMDLITTQADTNTSNLEYVSKFLVRKFYREWVDSIKSNTDLSISDGKITAHNCDFMFVVDLGGGREFMLNSWSKAFDIITSEHPNIFIDAGVSGNQLNARVYYDKCLNDVIEFEDMGDNELIKNWKKKRNV